MRVNAGISNRMVGTMERHGVGNWVEMIVLSELDRSAGGRETWIYNFLPRWMMSDATLNLRLHAVRARGKHGDDLELLDLLRPIGPARFIAELYDLDGSRLPLFLAMARALRSRWRRQNEGVPRFTVVTGIMEAAMLLCVPKLRRAPVVVWIRTMYLSEKAYRIPSMLMPALKWLEIRLLSRADLLIANGDDISRYYARYGLDVKVVKNGVDLSCWKSTAPLLRKTIRVAYVGRVTEVKGFAQFVAVARIMKNADDAARYEFHVAGASNPRASRDKAALAGALSDNLVVYHGPINSSDMPGFLQEMDVCVALTYSGPANGGGGTSNALMEQMASSRIIVAWDNPIFRQLLDDRNSYLVPQGDVNAIAAALKSIADLPASAVERSFAARRTIEHFSIDAQMKNYIAILEAAGLGSNSRLPQCG